ncbi:MAG: flagellar basal body L-ring protein FlgH [Candidatus Saganbacteria bacterium]|nr:flagellar basal body L-ring protein FlgH [Candidatus Saganbacteria bacterium]
MSRCKFLLIVFLVFVVSCLLLVVSPSADSLWQEGSASPYTTEKYLKIGDIITVLVLESTSAIQKAGTDTNIRDEFGAKLSHNFARLAALVPLANTADGEMKNKYSGLGKTERSSSLKTKISVVVTEILTNGNLRVAGKHKLTVNDDDQEILVGGIIRSKDVSIANTIYSYQVADAEITVKGTGVIQEAESPGWVTRFLNWLF